jgi:hypothetical protein
MEIDVREAVAGFQEMFPKEFEIVVLTLTNRKLSQETAELRQELESLRSSRAEE